MVEVKKSLLRKDVKILVAEDDPGHASLIKKNLQRSGITNEIVEFHDGSEVLDYLFDESRFKSGEETDSYLLLLDLKMPRVDGEEVLRKIKGHDEFKKISVIVLTSDEDPATVMKCYDLGCSNYILKPVDSDTFMDVIGKLGMFLMIVEVPSVTYSTSLQDRTEG